MGSRVAGKVAMVTGGSGGIGLATARLLWEEGASVAIVDLDEGTVRAASKQVDATGERALGVAADLSVEDDCRRAVEAAVSRYGKLDVLVNAAAIRVYGPITEATRDSWDSIIGVNLLGVAQCCKYAIPAMARSGGGSVINVSSSNASVGRSGMVQYDATKSALLAMTRAMACDHVSDGIRVNTVSPGPTLTPFHVRRRQAETGESFEQAEAALSAAGAPGTLLGRQAGPIEIAYPILFLASDESSYITAANLPVDGGLKGLRP